MDTQQWKVAEHTSWDDKGFPVRLENGSVSVGGRGLSRHYFYASQTHLPILTSPIINTAFKNPMLWCLIWIFRLLTHFKPLPRTPLCLGATPASALQSLSKVNSLYKTSLTSSRPGVAGWGWQQVPQINGHLKFSHMVEALQLHVLITTRVPCKAVC